MSPLKLLNRPLSTLLRTKFTAKRPNVFPKRHSCNISKFMKVAVLGASGHIGQHLSLMLKQSPLIDELAVYDVVGTCGFGMELAHIDTRCKVSAYTGIENIKDALHQSKVVVVVAAAPRTNHMAYSAMFEPNAHIMQELSEMISQCAPKAIVAIATDPLNSMVPLVSEVLKKNCVYNPSMVFGVTALDVVRTNTFVAHIQGLEPECVLVPVIGGHIDKTIVPVLSQARPCAEFTNEELEKITTDVQNARHVVVKAKKNQAATLSSAFAVARFVISIIKGLRGQGDVVECAYVRSDLHPNAKYLATPIQLGPGGIQRNLGIPKLTEYEKCQLENAVSILEHDIKKGEMFVGVQDPPPCDPCAEDPKPAVAKCPPDWCEKKRNRKLSD